LPLASGPCAETARACAPDRPMRAAGQCPAGRCLRRKLPRVTPACLPADSEVTAPGRKLTRDPGTTFFRSDHRLAPALQGGGARLEHVDSLARTHAVRRQEPDARRRRRSRRREACEEECARDGLVGMEDERRGLQSPDVGKCVCVRMCAHVRVRLCAFVRVCE
jgi:hypothetical protein